MSQKFLLETFFVRQFYIVTKKQNKNPLQFVAALSSSRSLVVGWLIGRLVGWLLDVCEKVTFRVWDGN